MSIRIHCGQNQKSSSHCKQKEGQSAWEPERGTLVDLEVPGSPRQHVERVDKHVAREEDVEVAEPQHLAHMAPHGRLTERGQSALSHSTETSIPRDIRYTCRERLLDRVTFDFALL